MGGWATGAAVVGGGRLEGARVQPLTLGGRGDMRPCGNPRRIPPASGSMGSLTHTTAPFSRGWLWGGDSDLGVTPCIPSGFSLDSGKGLTRAQELSFVAGAPRANHTGAVVLLRRDALNRLVPEALLPGEQLTSAFGYALALADLNSDG